MGAKDDLFFRLINERRPGMVTDLRSLLAERYGRSVRVARPRGSSAAIASFHHSASNARVGWEGVLESSWDFHIRTNRWTTGGYALLVDQDGEIYVCAAPFADMTFNAGERWNPITVATCAIGYFHPPHNHRPSSAMLQSLYSIGLSIDDASGARGGIPWRPHGALKQTACPGSLLTPHIWRMTGSQFGSANPRPEVYVS